MNESASLEALLTEEIGIAVDRVYMNAMYPERFGEEEAAKLERVLEITEGPPRGGSRRRLRAAPGAFSARSFSGWSAAVSVPSGRCPSSSSRAGRPPSSARGGAGGAGPCADGERRRRHPQRPQGLHLRRLRGRRQDHHLGRPRGRARLARPEGRGADDRPREAPGRLARARGARQRAAPGRSGAVRERRDRDGGRALGDDAGREGDLRRAGAQARSRRGDPRPHPPEPHLPPALERAGRLTGVHGDGEALRDPPGGPLRLPRSTPSLAQRLRLSSTLPSASPSSSRGAGCRCS